MSIMEINTLTGYRADNLDQLQSQSSTVKRVDSDKSKIIFYLDEVGILFHLTFTYRPCPERNVSLFFRL